MKQTALMSALFLFVLPVSVFAGEVDLPKTGQTTCYDPAGNVINCQGTGQDGDIQAGVQWPDPRFVDNGDGTITDHLTGLIWLKNANCFGKRTWAYAVSYCNTLTSGSCGLTDGSVVGEWRLPNIVELESLVYALAANPSSWLNTQGFSNVQSYSYWSSSTSFLYDPPGAAWGVDFSAGFVYDGLKHFDGNVWPVRDGQNGPAQTWCTGQTTIFAAGDDGDLQRGVIWPAPRFTDNGDGTITDDLTGLIWLKNANCFEPKTWQDALGTCNTLASGSCGLTDGSVVGEWRLPNRKELFSLYDFSRYNPALPPEHLFTNVQFGGYWSSSTAARLNYSHAWVAFMDDVFVESYNKSNHGYVWPVLGGQVEDPCSSLGGDTDGDRICDDGDGSGTTGDYPCTGGETENCDDNCPHTPNSDQLDSDGDGIGDVCEGPPRILEITGTKEPGGVITIIGSGFGDVQGDSVLHINRRSFDASFRRVKEWNNSTIEFKLPYKQKPCEWFNQNEDGDYRRRKVWVTVNGVDSRIKRFKLAKPSSCP